MCWVWLLDLPPLRVYKELVRMHQEDGLSFENVVTFNLDEYYPMEPKALQSYVRFMDENIFNHINIDKENINIPDGTLDQDLVPVFCADYEQKIEFYGDWTCKFSALEEQVI